MCHALLHDPAFFRLLTRIDVEFATEARQSRCPRCQGPLHVSDYPRKPRGCPPSVLKEYSQRLSFTCGWCDQRTRPASVRFLGRRVYVAVALMLLCRPASSAAYALGGAAFGVCAHGEAVARLVAEGFPANRALAVGARTLHAAVAG